MMSYFILAIVLISISILAYKLCDKDILGPSFVSSCMFSFSVIFSIIGLFSWNLETNLSFKTIVIFILGISGFIIGEYFARKYKIVRNNNIISYFKEKYSEKKNIKKIVLIICLIFAVLTTVLIILEIKRICSHYEFYSNSISELLAFYRNKTELFNSSAISVNFFVKQMKKVCDVINLILSYFFINKIVNKDNKLRKADMIITALTILICLFQTFLNSGGRSILMHFLVSYLFLYLFLKQTSKKPIKFNLKFIGIIAAIGISGLILFYSLLPLVGRKTSHNFTEYTSFYLGCSVPSFERFIDKKIVLKPKAMGAETFSGIYYVLNKFNIIDYKRPLTYEWTFFVPGLSSNVYTSLRSYYHDFGLIGVIVLQFFFGFICTKFYLLVKKNNSTICLIIYSYFFYILIDQIRVEQFYSLINTSNFLMIVLFVVFYRILLCKKSNKADDCNEKST